MIPTLTLNNQVEIPVLGLGVYKIEDGDACYNAVLEATRAGYRHIDTAYIYDNEASVGKAIRNCGIDRKEIFVTTKLWNNDHGYDRAIRAFDRSLKNLGLEYVDLYLIHWPVSEKRLESWKALETLYAEGRCRAIGVSNFMIHHLEELLGTCKIKPAINQVEMHPFNYLERKALVDFCFTSQIQVEAYSPLVKGKRMTHPELLAIAGRYGKSPAQMLIRWGLQMNFVLIPKSKTPSRIRENAEVFDFEISPDDMHKITSLNEDFTSSWNPVRVP